MQCSLFALLAFITFFLANLTWTDILSIYAIQDIIPIPSNVKYALAKSKWEDILTFPKIVGKCQMLDY